MVETPGAKFENAADLELDDGGDIPIQLEEDHEEEEMFNP